MKNQIIIVGGCVMLLAGTGVVGAGTPGFPHA